VTAPTLEADPDCARPAGSTTLGPERRLRAELRPFAAIPPETWDRLAGLNPWATPFSAWAFHRAWWDAYGDNAHEETMVVVDAGAEPGSIDAEPIAIVPLMHRHVVEASDATTHTAIRHGTGPELTPVSPTAKAVYFGASYHADYATILGDPGEFPAVADALVDTFGDDSLPNIGHPAPWDAIDLRRLRTGDPAALALAAAFGRREITEGWTLNVEREEVCPVATIPADADMDGFLGTLGKKERHEIRRKVHRAEAAGEVELVVSKDSPADLEAFIDLHEARWGEEGLFPDTAGGAQSRVMFRRLFELFGSDGPLRLCFLTVGGRRIGAAVYFETADSLLYYNAGVDPAARALSPGVLIVEQLFRHAIHAGKRRVDFLRGDEPYKYEWGAVDEPIQRLLVRRTGIA